MKILNLNEYSTQKVGCLMLNFHVSNWSNFTSIIKVEDIYLDESDEIEDYGLEKTPHSTILYGLHEYDGIIVDIKNSIPKLEYFDDVFRGNISIFESEKYDIVKFEIESNKLKDLNLKLKETFKNIDNFDYKPHMTIAFVKKGSGKNYIKDIKKIPMFPTEFIYSDYFHNKTAL